MLKPRQTSISILLTLVTFYIGTAQITSEFKVRIDSIASLIQIKSERGLYAEVADLATEAAYTYWHVNDLQEAFHYFSLAQEMHENMNDKHGAMLKENSLGLVLLELKLNNQAIDIFTDALEKSIQLNNPGATAIIRVNLAFAYKQAKVYEQSLVQLDKALTYAKKVNDPHILHKSYRIYFEIYDQLVKMNNDSNIFQHDNIEIFRLDTEPDILNEDSIVNFANHEIESTRKKLYYTTGMLRLIEDSLIKTEQINMKQQLELNNKQIEIDKVKSDTQTRNRITIIIVSALFITLLFLIVVFRQKNALRRNKELLERQNKNIRASIKYAQTIQSAILPSNFISNTISEAFALYMPKDIVSGDLYWHAELNPLVQCYAVVDCTGHGVPGAIMSMIGNQLLNEIILQKEVRSPKKILQLMDDGIRTVLKQNKTENTDGMEISICTLEKKTDHKVLLKYAGARRPLLYINNANRTLIRIKGSRKSVGGKGRKLTDNVFKEDEVLLANGDMIYMFSDGFVDQHNVKRKRYGSKNLENFLLNNYTENIQRQKELIFTEIRDYMFDQEQRDDITLVGIKIK